jgi:hypothetical protein
MGGRIIVAENPESAAASSASACLSTDDGCAMVSFADIEILYEESQFHLANVWITRIRAIRSTSKHFLGDR